MGNALGNRKTPSEIFFSNTILRTYINFSDPPLLLLIVQLNNDTKTKDMQFKEKFAT